MNGPLEWWSAQVRAVIAPTLKHLYLCVPKQRKTSRLCLAIVLDLSKLHVWAEAFERKWITRNDSWNCSPSNLLQQGTSFYSITATASCLVESHRWRSTSSDSLRYWLMQSTTRKLQAYFTHKDGAIYPVFYEFAKLMNAGNHWWIETVTTLAGNSQSCRIARHGSLVPINSIITMLAYLCDMLSEASVKFLEVALVSCNETPTELFLNSPHKSSL